MIRCPRCSYENPEAGQFCIRCGVRLDGPQSSQDENALERILRAVHARDVQEAPKAHRDKTSDCPPPPRFRALVYRPSTQTSQEQAHIAGCRYCQRTLRLCEQEAHHPPAEYLAEGRVPEEEEAEALTSHLEQDRCERCRRLTFLLRGIEAHLRGNFSLLVFGGPTDRLSSWMAWNAAVAATTQQFATGRPPRFFDQYRSQDVSITLTLRETDTGDLVLHIETHNPTLRGTLWHFALIDEADREVQASFVVLAPGFDRQRWVAELRLGSFAEVVRQTREGFHLVAYPRTAGQLTVEHRAALLWSVEAITGDREAVAEWEAFLDQSLDCPLPAPVARLLREVKAHLEKSKGENGSFSEAEKGRTSVAGEAGRARAFPMEELVQAVTEALDALGKDTEAGRKHQWERLVGQEQLLWRTCQATVQAEATRELDTLWRRRSHEGASAFVFHAYGEACWQALWGLVACAQVAVRARMLEVEGLLAWAQEALVGLGGTRGFRLLASPEWLPRNVDPQRIVTEVYQALGSQGSAAGVAQDWTLALLGTERSVVRALRMGVLGYQQAGFVAILMLELLAGGSGEFYPDPRGMVFIPIKESFREALDTAWRYTRTRVALPQGCDLRWRLEGRHLKVLDGASIGAAAAVGLRCLLEDRPCAPQLAITGAVDESGRVHRVQRVSEKVEAAAQHGFTTVIVPLENEREARMGAPTLEGIWTAATVEEAVGIASGLMIELLLEELAHLDDISFENKLARLADAIRVRARLYRLIKSLGPDELPEVSRGIAQKIWEENDRAKLAEFVRELGEQYRRVQDPTTQFWLATAIGKAGTEEAATVLLQLLQLPPEDAHPLARYGVIQALEAVPRQCLPPTITR